jgi:hypothetical protein
MGLWLEDNKLTYPQSTIYNAEFFSPPLEYSQYVRGN